MNPLFKMILLIFFVAPGAFAATAAQLLAQDFKSAKIQFGQEKRLYHYFNIHNESNPAVQVKLQSPEGRKQLVQERVQYATSKFWSPLAKITGMYAGEGLYLAIDPLISADYGNLMIEFKVKPTSYYINLKKGLYISKKTVRALYKEGYKTLLNGDEMPESMRFSEMNLNSMLTPENQKFRALVLQVLKAENIMLMEYEWKSELATVCREDSSSSAFVYIGTAKDLPEFTSVVLADVKDLYSLSQLTNQESLAKYDSQSLLRLMTNNGVANSPEDRSPKVLSSLFGCSL